MNYQRITKFDTANGPGIRTVLWISGCSHYCKGCHNPQTWDPNSGQYFNDDTMDEILDSLAPDYISGLTISGGDPLHPSNAPYVREIISTVRQYYPKKSIWVYTGYRWGELMDIIDDSTDRVLAQSYTYILNRIDVLVDGRYEEKLRDITLPYCGSTNQRVIDVKRFLYEGRLALYK